MTSKLYELQDQLVVIDNILANNTNPETEEILESAKDELLQAIGDKVENILNFIADCNAKADQLKQEEERLYKKRKTLDKKVEYLKGLVFGVMKQNEQQKATYGTWDCTIAKTTPKIIIDDEQWVPDCCCKTTRVIDKTELKKYIFNGEYRTTIDGQEILVAHTEQGESLRIK